VKRERRTSPAAAYLERQTLRRAPRRRANPPGPSAQVLGTLHELTLPLPDGRICTLHGTGGTRVRFTRDGLIVEDAALAGVLASKGVRFPCRPGCIKYGHAQGGAYAHEFSRRATASFQRTPGRIVVSNVRVKPFIEG